ncbi:hypothetical protein B5C34_08690 [Pacificimonas flava]|uniref:Heme exporter protein B n=2 Tax=Pacificimonas TaxID=1960290 RepID=A0A219B6W6_9SPHN|nr:MULTISPECIES: heme exporter protein CcmB [Pacificimonas]MBZ6379260.1 heme exporter protein CcmB [Pacificimonas aurantium]OWV33528.1 hypothetical protein B5C34_08690 [Pacificimonas flava]
MTGLALFRRHIRPGDAFLPVAFFLLVLIVATFAGGPDRDLLERTGPATVWTGTLLAFLLPVATLFRADVDSGVLDQLRISGLACETIALVRIAALWVSVGIPLVFASLAGAVLLYADPAALLLPLLLGTIALAALGVTGGALVAGARQGEAVATLVLLPLAVPVLIFGVAGELRLLGAATLFLLFTCPLAAGPALRLTS